MANEIVTDRKTTRQHLQRALEKVRRQRQEERQHRQQLAQLRQTIAANKCADSVMDTLLDELEDEVEQDTALHTQDEQWHLTIPQAPRDIRTEFIDSHGTLLLERLDSGAKCYRTLRAGDPISWADVHTRHTYDQHTGELLETTSRAEKAELKPDTKPDKKPSQVKKEVKVKQEKQCEG